MMKVTVFFVLTLFSSAVFSEAFKIVYHLNEKEKSQVLIASVNNILELHPKADIKLIMHSQAIMGLSKQDNLHRDFIALLKKGVAIGACSISMLKHKTNPDLMIEGVEFLTEGGILRIVRLQQQGYLYIKL